MKFITTMIVFLMALAQASAQQSSSNHIKKEEGYWVIESNLNTPMQHTIRFYNSGNTLIAIKQLAGVKLNVNRRKTRKELDRNLNENLIAWQRQHALEMASR